MKFGLDDSTIEKIKTLLSSFPEVEEVILYGSRAKGSEKKGSDIDLTFKGTSLNLQVMNRIRNALHQMNTPYTFDLSIFANIENQDLIDHIERVGKKLV
jgi:predicted nucleotidyltransferase